MKYPVLVTRGIVVFPGHTAQISTRSKQALNAIDLSVVQNEAHLVLVSRKEIVNENQVKADDIYNIGTLVTVKIEKAEGDNIKTISVKGKSRVKLNSFDDNKGEYFESEIEILKSTNDNDLNEQQFVANISKQMESIVGSAIPLPKNVLSSLASGITASELADIVAHYAPINFKHKQKLLEALDVTERLKLVTDIVTMQHGAASIDKVIDTNVKNTLDNQQKEYLLRERMKAIKEELGEISSKDSDIDEWRKKLKDSKYPKDVRQKALEEIKRYESMPPISAEAHVSKGYIEWLIQLPWKTYTRDNDNLDSARATLKKHHYGLKDVKDRIIEHLAVRLNTNSENSPMLTLLGPPGVGKTSLAKSVAEAMGRELIKVSLGGVRDEAEIRGHRRTYVGAMPGKIIQAINKAKTSNPIILLDEIDKMSSDQRGDPTSAMLEVLDPEQNTKFQDHYLEVEYDLSKVMFFATANFYEQIPGPLLDRVELIELNQYTSDEKLQIAKKHIIPKVIKDHGLKAADFRIEDDVIEYIIDKYTREAGVRGLQRAFEKIARKIVVGKLEKEIKGTFYIDKKHANKFLGKEKVHKEILEGNAEIGLTNGMYYSSVGGGILPIEVTTYPASTGSTILTGSIKDVMKESLKIAVAYIRSNAKKFGIDFDFEKNIIQVHVPEGATPKDGPSAGIAFTTAVLSALVKKPVPRDIALTGEITLRGKVLMIGGLKEKTIGAVEAGVKRIFIPKTNEKDIPELAKKVIDTAKIIEVSDFTEVYQNIFA